MRKFFISFLSSLLSLISPQYINSQSFNDNNFSFNSQIIDATNIKTNEENNKQKEKGMNEKKKDFFFIFQEAGIFYKSFSNSVEKIIKGTEYYSLRMSLDYINSYFLSYYYLNNAQKLQLPNFVNEESKRIANRFGGELLARVLRNTAFDDWYTKTNEKLNDLIQKYTYTYEGDAIEKVRMGPALKLEADGIGINSFIKVNNLKAGFEIFLDEMNINLIYSLKEGRIGTYYYKNFEGKTEYGILLKYSF